MSIPSLRALEQRLGSAFRVHAFELDAPGRRVAATVEARADYAPFRGHFPGSPILPAVAQLGLVADLAAAALGVAAVRITTIRRARFLGVVGPETPIQVQMDLSGSGSILAALTRDGITLAEMRLAFQKDP